MHNSGELYISPEREVADSIRVGMGAGERCSGSIILSRGQGHILASVFQKLVSEREDELHAGSTGLKIYAYRAENNDEEDYRYWMLVEVSRAELSGWTTVGRMRAMIDDIITYL